MVSYIITYNRISYVCGKAKGQSRPVSFPPNLTLFLWRPSQSKKQWPTHLRSKMKWTMSHLLYSFLPTYFSCIFHHKASTVEDSSPAAFLHSCILSLTWPLCLSLWISNWFAILPLLLPTFQTIFFFSLFSFWYFLLNYTYLSTDDDRKFK